MGEGSGNEPSTRSLGVSSPLGWPQAAVQIVHLAALATLATLLCKWHMVDPLVALGSLTMGAAATAAEPSLLRRLLPRKDPES